MYNNDDDVDNHYFQKEIRIFLHLSPSGGAGFAPLVLLYRPIQDSLDGSSLYAKPYYDISSSPTISSTVHAHSISSSDLLHLVNNSTTMGE